MDQTQVLVQAIVNGLQEKKGKNIVVVDLSSIEGAICQYMVIGEGNSPSQVSTLCDSVWDFARREAVVDRRRTTCGMDRYGLWNRNGPHLFTRKTQVL